MSIAYPRLNLGEIRAKVREITSIEATTVISNDHIDNIVNEELHKLILLADEVEQFWPASAGGPITVTENGVTYRVPGWRFDNTSQFPNGLPGEIYMYNDADLAPWNTTSTGVYKAGFYDNFLVYATAARVLRDVNDDTNRAEVYDNEARQIAQILVQQEFIAHNADLTTVIPSNSPNFFIRLYFKALYLLKKPLTIDADYSLPLLEVTSAILDSQSELRGKYVWPASVGNFSDWNPYADIFAYAAAARVGARVGLSDAEINSLLAEYKSREDALVREKLRNEQGVNQPGTLGQLRFQVRALLGDFSTELPTPIIDSWINSAYQQLAVMHPWPWLTSTVNLFLSPGQFQSSLSGIGVDYRILNCYVVETDGAGQVTDAQIVAPVPHILDGEQNASKYRYDITNGVFQITPTPNETLSLLLRVVTNAPQLSATNDAPLFDARFRLLLAYRAAVIGSIFSDKAKQMQQVYAQEAENLYQAMYRYYMVDHSTEPFSIGENSLETRKYLPFFKAQ